MELHNLQMSQKFKARNLEEREIVVSLVGEEDEFDVADDVRAASVDGFVLAVGSVVRQAQ